MKTMTGKMLDGTPVTIEFEDRGIEMMIVDGESIPAWTSVFKAQPFGELCSKLRCDMIHEGGSVIAKVRQELDYSILRNAGVDVSSIEIND